MYENEYSSPIIELSSIMEWLVSTSVAGRLVPSLGTIVPMFARFHGRVFIIP
jgi:hypothetical protein